MTTLEAIVRQEPLEDVLAVFALKVGYPMIDSLYVRYGGDNVSNLDVLLTYQRLVDEGVLIRSARMMAVKGPNWKEPAFIRDGKYKQPVEG